MTKAFFFFFRLFRCYHGLSFDENLRSSSPFCEVNKSG